MTTTTDTPGGGGEAAQSLPLSELAAHLRIVVMRLHRRLRSEADDELSPTLVAALVSVEREGPLTLGRLAELERVTPPSITRAVTALERDGLVRRESDPDDRRVSRVAVTPEGAALLRRSRRRKAAFLARRLAHLEARDQQAVGAALPVLERLLESDP
jgi:DNA-binding MarR family transcriptional regulator